MPASATARHLPTWIEPKQPLAPGVRAVSVTRAAPGRSQGPFAACNLGAQVGDDPAAVAANRALLLSALGLPAPPRFLRQVHGATVVDVDHLEGSAEPEGDAAFTTRRGVVLAVLTADCVPVLLAADDGSLVAVAHAGWRGLAVGVIPALIQSLPLPSARLRAWLGPAISKGGYEVGPEVREALIARDPRHAIAFEANDRTRYRLDLHAVAHQQLAALGVAHVEATAHRTDLEPALWYSHRRDGARTGRFASLIWIEG